VDVEAGTAARAIFTDEAIWQLEQERIFAKKLAVPGPHVGNPAARRLRHPPAE